jgi:hypothetical protein
MATVPQFRAGGDAIARAREHLEPAKALLPHVGFDAGTTLCLVEMALYDLQALMTARGKGREAAGSRLNPSPFDSTPRRRPWLNAGMYICVRCLSCAHCAVLDRAALAGHSVTPSAALSDITRRLRCSRCRSGAVEASRVGSADAARRWARRALARAHS